MRRSVLTLVFVLSILPFGGLSAAAGDGPGPWGDHFILCIEGYHLPTNPAHPEWGTLPMCVPDRGNRP
jgi:hypothetical protein